MNENSNSLSTIAAKLVAAPVSSSVEDFLFAISRSCAVAETEVGLVDLDASHARQWRATKDRAEYEATLASVTHSSITSTFGGRLASLLSHHVNEAQRVFSAFALLVEYASESEIYKRPAVEDVIDSVQQVHRDSLADVPDVRLTAATLCGIAGRRSIGRNDPKSADTFFHLAIEFSASSGRETALLDYVLFLIATRRFRDAAVVAKQATKQAKIEANSPGRLLQVLANTLLGGRVTTIGSDASSPGLDSVTLSLLLKLTNAKLRGDTDDPKVIDLLTDRYIVRIEEFKRKGKRPYLSDYLVLIKLLEGSNDSPTRPAIFDVAREGYIWGATDDPAEGTVYDQVCSQLWVARPASGWPQPFRVLGTVRSSLATHGLTSAESYSGETGLVWNHDHRASHEAICPVCGAGGPVGSGIRSVTVNVFFDRDGPAKDSNRKIGRLEVKCEQSRPSLGHFPESVIASNPHSVVLKPAYGLSEATYRDGRTVREYLRLIESPLISHPSIQAIPSLAELANAETTLFPLS